MGKGLTAAAGMGRVRNALRALALTDPRPAAVLAGLDRLFIATELEEQVTTVAYLVLDPATGEGIAGSAGHLPPLMLSVDAPPHLGQAGGGGRRRQGGEGHEGGGSHTCAGGSGCGRERAASGRYGTTYPPTPPKVVVGRQAGTGRGVPRQAPGFRRGLGSRTRPVRSISRHTVAGEVSVWPASSVSQGASAARQAAVQEGKGGPRWQALPAPQRG